MREEIRPPLLSRVPARAWLSLDAGVAVFLAATFLGLASTRNTMAPDPLDYVAALATSLPIAVRRLRPQAVFLVVLAGGLGMREFLIPHADLLCLPLALYTVATRNRALVPLAAAVAVGLQGVVELPVTAEVPGQLALVLAILVASWAVGTTVRQRRVYTERLAVHAEEQARAEAAEERLRIARELHDVIGHSLSTIAVQAGVAGHVGAVGEMSRALSSIEETSRSALRETRRLLGLLRDDDEAELARAPGLADLDVLVRRAEATGLEVELAIDGKVKGEMELTVYRIVQEALTNVVKHADARHVDVRIERLEGELIVKVVDDGMHRPARPNAHAQRQGHAQGQGHGQGQEYGHGLTGLHERVRVFGGEFTAGAHPPGGFQVMARLPL
ncbi:sensor histidine kinase [Nonomuraea sp. SBT364]|uniref:sensor histidine kinase n=1 Tax=Nonomuraea sp. SBT364 TaxID=1580530 RepID=UPI000A704790|nr:histidine kinase [Nonomuraea sp. SBT364]